MTVSSDAPSDNAVPTELADLRAEVSALSDLFRRRLLEDRTHRHVVDVLLSRAQAAEAGLAAEYLIPVVVQLFRLAERAEMSDTGDPELVDSLIDEMRVILDNCGVTEIADVAVPVDRLAHEVRVVHGTPPGVLHVTVVLHRGYRYLGKVLRPAVVEATYRTDQEGGRTETHELPTDPTLMNESKGPIDNGCHSIIEPYE